MFLLFQLMSSNPFARNLHPNSPVLVQLELGNDAVGRSNANLHSLARDLLTVQALNVDNVALAVD